MGHMDRVQIPIAKIDHVRVIIRNTFLQMIREDLTPAAVVTDHGLKGTHPICVQTLEIFARLLGSQAGDVVLTYLSTGGLFLGGGIPSKVAAKLQEGGTVEAYLRKGRLSPLVEMTPLHIIKNNRAAMLGRPPSPPACRLLINAHLRRYAHPSSLRRTQCTPHSSGFRMPCSWAFLNSLLDG